NVFSLANNHSADFGLEGIRATKQSSAQLLRQHPQITFSGLRYPSDTRKTDKPFQMESIERQGWKIGFSALSILTNRHEGIEELQYIHIGDPAGLRQYYAHLQAQRPHYDLIIVSVHGGDEYKLEATEPKKRIMQQMVNHGADIIWGHHPHVQQPWEIREGRGGEALIMYSQGNFISAQTIRTKAPEPQGFWAATGDAVLLQVEVGKAKNGMTQLHRIQPQNLSTIRLKPFAFAVVPLADAAAAIAEQGYKGWETFYTYRRKWLEKRVAQWPQR
ncbi:MAG: CapA family protein, partial [Spirochaetota bacterium]